MVYDTAAMTVTIDDAKFDTSPGELVLEMLARAGHAIPQVCYHPQLGPIQTCDTCMVEVDGRLVRACGTVVRSGAEIVNSARAQAARAAAMDVILGNHELYCTVCDNNNQNCTVHNTTALMEIEHPGAPVPA